MLIDLQTTVASLLELPPQDRLRIGETLIESVGDIGDETDAIVWSETIERRIRELRSGAVRGIPADEVFAQLDCPLFQLDATETDTLSEY